MAIVLLWEFSYGNDLNLIGIFFFDTTPDSKVNGAKMGPTWCKAVSRHMAMMAYIDRISKFLWLLNDFYRFFLTDAL